MTKKLKKPIAFLTVFAMLLSVLLYFPEGTFGGLGLSMRASAETTLNPSSDVETEKPTEGIGTSSDPYIITTKAELYWFANQTNNHAKLGADIVVNSDVLDSNGDLNSGIFDEWPGINIDSGSFDGNNYTIKGIIVKQPTLDNQGFITGYFKGKVKNLKIVDSYIEGQDSVGGICGSDYAGLVSNCSFDGTVIGNLYVGGICGHVEARDYIVEKCTNTGKVSGAKCVGGIVGYADCLIKIEKCVNKGNISGTEHIGGIAGNSKQSLVKECWNEGEISGTEFVAGVVGYEYGTSSLGPGIRNCYNIGKVSGGNYVAGIAANVEEIEYCYNIGEVTGTNKVYGVGTYSASKVSNCYYDNIKCPRDDSNYYYATGLGTSAFTSGVVAFKLRGGGEDCWGQNIDNNNIPKDNYPILTNDPELAVYHGKVDGNDKYHNHLTAECEYCPYIPKNPSIENGKYIIKTPNELYWFTLFVNGVSVTTEKHSNASAVLATDIELNRDVLSSVSSGNISNLNAWTPIGDNSNPFTGSFDGNGYTISGLYFNNTADYVGLFGAIGSSGSVSDVGVVDSYFKGNVYVGSIAGKNDGKISGCFSKSGKVEANSNYGGICGSGDTNVVNSFYNITVSGAADSSLNKNSAAFSGGEVTYLLNGDQSRLVWGQTLSGDGKNTQPVRNNGDNTVYKGRKIPEYHNHIPSDVDCAKCPTFYAKEITPNNGVYEISDVNELYWFAQFVNSGNSNAKAVLTDDITANDNVLASDGSVNIEEFAYWTPIGTSSSKFNGSFNGNGHTISGLYFNDVNADYAGLFGYLSNGSRVSNVGVVDSYFNGKNAGGIAGKNDGTITGCFSISTVVGSTGAGGISGSGSGTVNNGFYLDIGVPGAVDVARAKDSTAFTSGEVAYLLNGDQSVLVWGQTLEGTINDQLPVRITGENAVYCGTDEQGLTKYHNHAYDMEFCSYCSYIVPVIPQKDGDVYQIYNARELYGFAALVNGTVVGTPAEPAAKGVLVNNITIEQNADLFDNNGNLTGAGKANWTPIGDYTNQFTGTLEGKGFTISGLYFNDENADYAGLFGYIGEGGSVSNVGVVDSYFKGKNAGGIAGQNNGTICGCFSTSTVVGSTCEGGISGSGTVNNSFYLDTGVANAVDSALEKDSTVFAGGEVAYLLNGDQSNRVWGQSIGNNTLPVPRTTPNTVYLGIDGEYHNHASGMTTCGHCSTVIPVTPGLVGGVYQITSAGELYGFAEIVNGSYERTAEPGAKAILKNNITVNADPDLGKVNWTPIGSSSKPFTGSFDGNGYTISGLYFENNTASNIGLIGYAGSSAQISGVCVSNATFSGDEYIGAVCGYNNGGSISGCCSTDNQISGKYAGGISGYNSGTVENCYNTGAVSGTQAAGIVSQNDGSGKLQYCINVGEISGTDCTPVCASTRNVTNCFYNEDFSACTGGAGKAVSTYALTGDSFLTASGFDTSIWEKAPNDENYLYYPSFKNISENAPKVGYTARFVLENTTSAPIVYSKDMSFTFDAVFDLEGRNDPVSVTSQINPMELAQMDFAVEHNGEPLDAEISYTVDLASGKLILLIDGKEAGYIAFDNESKNIKVLITEDLNAGENTVNLTYNGRSVPLFTGEKGSCTVTIEKAVPVIEWPDATGISYGQPLSASTLSSENWSWVDGTVIPTVTNSGYNAVSLVDDENYIFDDVEGYSPAAHTLTKAIPVAVAAAVPAIVVTADTGAMPGSKMTVRALVSNPSNSTLTDLPAVSGYTYRIGDGAEQTITNGSFVIPKNTPKNSTITITAKTPATENYAAGTGTVTVLVTDCRHTNKTLKYDENKHWYYCSDCGADINISVHSGGTATCTSRAVCEVCGQEYGTVDSNNHTGVSSVWNYDGTAHWHICSDCKAQVDKAAHVSSSQATAEKAEVCTVCGYEITPQIGHVSTPIISPNGGTFTDSQVITITCRTDGAAIYYTLDGTVPTTNSAKCTGAFTLTESRTVKAVAIKVGMSNSTVAEAVFTKSSSPVDPVVETVAAPVIAPNGGNFTGSQRVTITCATDGADIYYTTDGTTPTTASTKYTGEFTISSTTTIKAIAVNSGMNNSDIVYATFTKKSSGGSGGGYRPTTPTTSNPSIGGTTKSWSDVAADLAKLTTGSEVTIELNGNTTVPIEVIKMIAEKKLKATFVVDSVKSWKTDGAEITTPAAADLSIITTRQLKTDTLRGVEGIQFTINNTNIPTNLEISFKAEHAGKFANLYKVADGKFTFVTCAKLGTDGKVILSEVTEKGNYVVMLCEFSDRPGDMNNDGVLNAMDASAILKDIVGLEKGKNPLMADYNGDGKINALDASAILKRIIGLA